MTNQDILVARACAEVESWLARARAKVNDYQRLERPLNTAELVEVAKLLANMEALTRVVDDLLAVKAAPGH